MGKGVGVGDLPLGEGYNYDSAIEGSFFGGYATFFFKICPLRYSLAELESELQYMGDVRKFKKKKIRSLVEVFFGAGNRFVFCLSTGFYFLLVLDS